MKSMILKTLMGFSSMFGREFDQEGFEIWFQILKDLSPEELKKAVETYAKDPELCKFFPQPGQLYGLVRPQQDKEEQASVIVDNIFQALRRYGADKFNQNRAKLKIGPVGWQWIEQQGGWEVWVSTVISEEMVPILRSQARKSIMGLIQIEKNLQITGGEQTKTLADLGVKMKEIE